MVEYLDGGRIQGSTGDSLGSSADGVNTNVSLDTTNEKLGTGCYDFDGSGDKVTIGTSTTLSFLTDGSTDWTIAFWMKLNATEPNGNNAIFCQGQGNEQGLDILFDDRSAESRDHVLGVRMEGVGGHTPLKLYTGAQFIPKDTNWHHYVITADISARTITAYRDGANAVSDSTGSGTFPSASDLDAPMTFGVHPSGGFGDLNAKLDDCGIWNKILPLGTDEDTEGSIKWLYNTGTGRLANTISGGLKVYYSFDTDTCTNFISDEKTTITNVPSGTRYEEIDTRQIYLFNPNAPWTNTNWTERNETPSGAFRGVIGGGTSASADVNVMDYVTIGTLGNASDFGDLTDARGLLAGVFDATRGVFVGGKSSYTNTMDYITIGTTGNASDFGDNTTDNAYLTGVSSDVRGCMGGGWRTGYSNVISYITIQTTGNASDFGDLVTAREQPAGVSDLVRGVFIGGTTSRIDYITIATTGNATDFGTSYNSGKGASGVSNTTRGVWAGRGGTNEIYYMTIQTTGTVSDFGDQVTQHEYTAGVQGNDRGIWGGGYDGSNKVNHMDYVTISTTGNSVDFGDLTVARNALAGVSGG